MRRVLLHERHLYDADEAIEVGAPLLRGLRLDSIAEGQPQHLHHAILRVLKATFPRPQRGKSLEKRHVPHAFSIPRRAT